MRVDRREDPGGSAARTRLSHRPTPVQNLVSAGLRSWLAIALAGALWTAGAAAAEPADSRLKQSSEELERIRRQMQSVGQTIEADRGQQDELRDAVETAERKVGEAQRQLRRLTQQIDDQEAKVRQAESGRVNAEARLDRQRQLLARQLRAAYVMQQGGGKTQVLLNQDDPDRVDRMLTYYDALNQARSRTIASIDAEIRQVVAERQKYETELAALRALQSQHRRAVVELDGDRAERAQAVARVNARIRDETQEMARLQGNEKQLQALLQKLREAMVEKPQTARETTKATPEMRGQHEWPLRGPILANYGETKAGGKLQWKGLWIGSAEGAAVKATARGRVAYVGWLSSYGLIVVIEHERGYFTLYGHNAAVSKAAGDTVNAGDVIASAGNTGGYEQTGLYFEVRRGTEPQDPTGWLGK